MKPAGKGALAEYEEVGGFAMLLDGADVEALESGEHGGGHASADKLPDADFFNGARLQSHRSGAKAEGTLLAARDAR